MSELYCELCKYKTTVNADWLKHINTAKHKRNGEKKTTKCDLCDYESVSHWNIKIHKIQIHATTDEKSKCKYYCKDCNVVLMCNAYMDRHNNGIHHKNQVLVNKSLENIK